MTGKTITIAQQKGGSGKTTLTANLAVAFANSGKSVAIVDTDPQGSLGRWFMARNERTDGAPGLDFSTSSAWGVEYEARKLTDEFDIVLVDTPPKVESDLRPALRIAALVIVPVAASQVDLWATESILDMVKREEKQTMLVLNRMRTGTNLSTEMLRKAAELDAGLAQTTLANRVVYAETLGTGLSVLEAARNSPASDEVRALAKEIEAAIEN